MGSNVWNLGTFTFRHMNSLRVCGAWCMFQGVGLHEVMCAGSRVWVLASMFRVWCLGFGVRGLGFGVEGLRFGVWSLELGVLGLGFRVCNLRIKESPARFPVRPWLRFGV